MQHCDSSDESADVHYVAVVDAVDARADGTPEEQTRWVLDAVPVTVLEQIGAGPAAQTPRQDFPQIDFLLLMLRSGQRISARVEELGGYISVVVSRHSRGSDDEIQAFATSLNGIDNDSIPFFVRINREPPKKQHVKTLKELARFSHIDDAESLAAFEPKNYDSLAVAVYDVGQGSMCALVDRFEHPVMFFDLGWPLSFFPQSVPATRLHFNPFPCVLEDDLDPTPVVLSHLDWDHWAFAYQSGTAKWDSRIAAWKTVPVYRTEALRRPWLLRRPDYRRHKLGGSHIHFVQTLGATLVNGTTALHFWPKSQRRKSLGPITLFVCCAAKGTPKTAPFLRNNQGLGLLVSDVGSGARVLLTGDADFPSIPLFAKQRLTGLVAPHHGGNVTKGSVPTATGHGRMVMSVYPGCYSNIPHPDVEKEAKEQGWRIAYTSERRSCFRSNKTVECGNRLIRLGLTPMCRCPAVPNACLCISSS